LGANESSKKHSHQPNTAAKYRSIMKKGSKKKMRVLRGIESSKTQNWPMSFGYSGKSARVTSRVLALKQALVRNDP
jgi:hypothetical protein